MRGKVAGYEVDVKVNGITPRMRGKAADALAQHTLLGITPAYAGKSPWQGCTV